MFHFTELEKLWFFSRSNSKITLIKTKCFVIMVKPIMVKIMVVAIVIVGKDKVTYRGLRILETIITEATFFSFWVFFHEHSRFAG